MVARRLLAVEQWEAVAHQVKHTGSHDTVALLRWGRTCGGDETVNVCAGKSEGVVDKWKTLEAGRILVVGP